MIKEFINQINNLPQKAFAELVGLDVDKPTIGVISAQNELSLADGATDKIVDKVREGILARGGIAKTLHISAIEGNAMYATNAAKYDLPDRELTANVVETLCANNYFDALVFVASRPNTIWGMLLGAIRLNMPCAFVCQGTMSPITYDGKQYGFEFFYRQVARAKVNKKMQEVLANFQAALPTVCGTDCDRYGQNSVSCLLEATGMAVQGNGTAAASSVERQKIAVKTGQLAVKLAQNKCTPRRILTQSMLQNMIRADLACGGSTTTMLGIIAVAKELGVRNVDFKAISEIAKTVPLLLAKPYDGEPPMIALHRAGGMYAVLKQLVCDKIADGEVYTGAGMTLSQLLQNVTVVDSEIVRTKETAANKAATLQVVKGNLAEEGAFVHYKTEQTFVGKAKVYESEESAIEAILHKEIRDGDVVVIRNEGPQSCPGMREVYMSLALLNETGLADKVAVITDGRIADIYDGIAVGHITPESGNPTAFTVLRDGDSVEISVPKGRIQCDLNAREVQTRLRNHDRGIGNYANAYLKQWSKTCRPATEGCVTDKSK